MSNQFPAITTESFITRATQFHGRTYDYSKSIYVNSNTPIIIICKEHGEFTQLPSNHYRCGCAQCATVTRAANKITRITTTTFIERAIELHGNKYDYSLVSYSTPWAKVTIICNTHGAFQSNYLHLNGIGCPQCGALQSVQTKIANGNAISPELRSDYELYEGRVNKITEYNYRKYKHLINPLNLKRARVAGYHVDHKFSKQAGFKEGILPEIIGHWSNLQMLEASANRAKYMSCSITKEQLLNNYKYIDSF